MANLISRREWRSQDNLGHNYYTDKRHKDTLQWTLIDIAVPADQTILTTEEGHRGPSRDSAWSLAFPCLDK